MESNNKASKDNNKENESAKPNPIIENIKSRYILSKIYDNIPKKKKLVIVKYNKRIQNILNLSGKDYEEYCKIEIEITLNKRRKFININKNDKLYYHMYFNKNIKEIKNKYEIEEEDDEVEKIKIIINYKVKSFEDLFKRCECIESINFKKFNRNNVNFLFLHSSFILFCCFI